MLAPLDFFIMHFKPLYANEEGRQRSFEKDEDIEACARRRITNLITKCW